jgi:hypothetical protein
MQTQILSGYLAEIARIRATRAGTGEISYYRALAGAFNATGERLKPRVFCVPNLRNRGSGLPDMGLFVEQQCGTRLRLVATFAAFSSPEPYARAARVEERGAD